MSAGKEATVRRFAAAYADAYSLDTLPIEFDVHRRARNIALHEAGHVVMRFFSGLEPSHVTRITIIPSRAYLGRTTAERSFAEGMLGSLPLALRLVTGRQVLLQLLGGRVAEELFGEDTEDALDLDSEEWDEPSADLYRAAAVADAIARRHLPAGRNLLLAERWTREAFTVPAVAETLNVVAEALLERGEITGRRAITSLCEPILCLGMKLPAWRRRLLLNRAEFERLRASAVNVSSTSELQDNKRDAD